MSRAYTYEQAAAAIERTDASGLRTLHENLRRLFAERPEELSRLEELLSGRMRPAPRAATKSRSRNRLPDTAGRDVGRSDVLAAIERYREDRTAFLEQNGAKEPKWVYLIDEADHTETRYPLKAIGLHLLGFEARDCTTNDIERLIDFERLGFKVLRTLQRPEKKEGHE